MHLHRSVVLLSALLATSGQAPAQSSATISSVDSDNDGRPVSALIGPLRQTEAIAISYEDPRYRNAEDVQDVTEQVGRQARTRTRMILAPLSLKARR
jgi:hypothetical protein